jgi:hypothetical protein
LNFSDVPYSKAKLSQHGLNWEVFSCGQDLATTYKTHHLVKPKETFAFSPGGDT